PVVAGAVWLNGADIFGLDDSKRLSAKRRAVLEVQIKTQCHWAIGLADPAEIDAINILNATMLAMTRAVSALCAQIGEPHDILIDGNLTPHKRAADWRWPARAIIGGDASEPCISAASIIAKEHRDRIMHQLAIDHPQYGWDRNAGYGTSAHMAALNAHGPTIHHRLSFAPVARAFQAIPKEQK
ncbi:MAG: hypothetical protein RLY97_1477, partial [Pseudomonadota bacterium]